MTENPADVSPGVVVFLLNNCKYCPEVVSRCLVELAAEGVVRLDPPPGAPLVSVSGYEPCSGRRLLPYEDVIVERVRHRGRQAPVPLPVLLSDDGDDYQKWQKQLTDALASQVKREGLARVTAGRAPWWIVLAVIIGTLAATLVGYQVKTSIGKVCLGIEFYASLFVLLVPLVLRRLRLTPKGAEVANWWRRQGGTAILDGSVSLDGTVSLDGSERAGQRVYDQLTAAEGIDQAHASLPPGHAWSPVGGHWHPVRIGKVPTPPQWGTRSALTGLIIWTVIGLVFFGFFGIGVLASVGIRAGLLAPVIPVAAGAIVIFGFWLPARVRLMRLPDSVTFTGQVVKRWTVESSEGPDAYRCSVDDGQSPVARTFDISRDKHQELRVGDMVQVTFSPRWRRLHQIERLETAMKPR